MKKFPPKNIESNILEGIIDVILMPVMFLLNGGKLPLQETHPWHCIDVDTNLLIDKFGVVVRGNDSARFGHDAPFGLFHMPIFGGLRKYTVIEVGKFTDHWHVCFKGNTKAQIHKLKIKTNRLKLLTGKGKHWFFALTDSGDFLPIKTVGEGTIGDTIFKGVRLF